MLTNPIPLSDGIFDRNVSRASSPPADAFRPSIEKSPVFLGYATFFFALSTGLVCFAGFFFTLGLFFVACFFFSAILGTFLFYLL
jgi:hypothetical protein